MDRIAERAEQPVVDQLAPRRTEPAGHDLAEQAVAEVGVVEPLPCPRHPAGAVVGGGERGEVASPRALPPRAARLALHPGRVRERLAHGDLAVADVAEVGRQRVVEVEQARVPRLHDQHGGHRLGDGPDAVLAVEPGRVAGAAGPHRAVAVEDGTDHGRQPALGLRDVQQSLPLVTHAETFRPRGQFSANASGGGQAQTRLRSPYAWSMRATGGQYLSGSMPCGKTASSRE